MLGAALFELNLINLAQTSSINAIIAFGMTLTVLMGAWIPVGAVVALVGTTTVYLLAQGGVGQHPLVLAGALLAGLGVAVLLGLFNGLCSGKTQIPPFIVTLATMQVARGAALAQRGPADERARGADLVLLDWATVAFSAWFPCPWC